MMTWQVAKAATEETMMVGLRLECMRMRCEQLVSRSGPLLITWLIHPAGSDPTPCHTSRTNLCLMLLLVIGVWQVSLAREGGVELPTEVVEGVEEQMKVRHTGQMEGR